MKKRFILVAALATLIAGSMFGACANDGQSSSDGPLTVYVHTYNSSLISLGEDSEVGDEIPLSIWLDDNDPIPADEVVWTSSNEQVACVKDGHRLECVAAGHTCITATLSDGRKVQYSFSVSECKDEHGGHHHGHDQGEHTHSCYYINLSVNCGGVVSVGDEIALKVGCRGDYLSDEGIVWSCDNSEVASLEGGVLRCHSAGHALITATLPDGTVVNCSCTVR